MISRVLRLLFLIFVWLRGYPANDWSAASGGGWAGGQGWRLRRRSCSSWRRTLAAMASMPYGAGRSGPWARWGCRRRGDAGGVLWWRTCPGL